MRPLRIIVEENGSYHITSRIIDKQFWLADPEVKTFFLALLFAQIDFAGLILLDYQIMDNHVHFVVRVPTREDLDDETLIARVKAFSGDSAANILAQKLEVLRAANQDDAAESLRARFLARMYDLSRFMQELKSTFSRWMNKRLGRKGPVWDDRFHSVVLETEGEAVLAASAYGCLNKVRAGMVDDPKDDKWCGYGAALRGCKRALAGLEEVLTCRSPLKRPTLKEYRMLVFVTGEADHENQKDAKGRHGFDRDAVEKVLEQGGNLDMKDRFRFTCQTFLGGCILGTQPFIEKIYRANPKKLGSLRKVIGHSLQIKDLGSLCALRGKHQ